MPEALKIPTPLEGDEIRRGIAKQMALEFEAAVYATLAKTCSLNRQSYPKFSASWLIRYNLDDFGRPVMGAMGGCIGEDLPEMPAAGPDVVESFEGKIDPMPPDRFRRETSQPIPQPVTVHKRPDDGMGMTRTPRGRRKGNGV